VSGERQGRAGDSQGWQSPTVEQGEDVTVAAELFSLVLTREDVDDLQLAISRARSDEDVDGTPQELRLIELDARLEDLLGS